MNTPSVEQALSGAWARLVPPPWPLLGIRVGLDVVDIDVLRRQIESTIGPQFVATRFSPEEIADARGRIERLASRWAIKEAVAKAIQTGFREGLSPRTIEVVTEASGAVSVRPSSDARWPHDAEQWTWSVSACHESDSAVAIAIAMSKNPAEGSTNVGRQDKLV